MSKDKDEQKFEIGQYLKSGDRSENYPLIIMVCDDFRYQLSHTRQSFSAIVIFDSGCDSEKSGYVSNNWNKIIRNGKEWQVIDYKEVYEAIKKAMPFKIESIHEDAIDLSEDAFEARRRGDEEEATKLLLEALVLEKKATEYYKPVKETEPTRSILYYSAASIAFHLKDYEQSKELAMAGLGGNPPIEIKMKLLEYVLDDDG